MTDQSKPKNPGLFDFADEIEIAVRHLQNSLNAIGASAAGEISGGDEDQVTFLECAERYAAQIVAIKDRMHEAAMEEKGPGHGS
jgi:hypothetical protein